MGENGEGEGEGVELDGRRETEDCGVEDCVETGLAVNEGMVQIALKNVTSRRIAPAI